MLRDYHNLVSSRVSPIHKPLSQTVGRLLRNDMARFRVLKSVGHNWANSLLSNCNFVGDTIVVQLLLELARKSGENIIIINPLNGTIIPEKNNSPEINEVLGNLPSQFEKALESQDCSINMVSDVQLHINFDIERINPKYSDISKVWYSDKYRMPEASTYKAWVRVIDTRGREYTSELREFWRN